jgi:glucan 1,3-beta-glucosidase
MQVLLGIWIGREDAKNEIQIAKAVDLANAHRKTIRAIIVGNEVLLRGEQLPEDLIRYLKEVKTATGLPVTYADVTDFWMKAPPELADAVDFITIHILPYWENNPVAAGKGVAYLKTVREDVATQFPGKRIFIGETGFPSAGRERAGAMPSIVSEARYLREFAAYAESVDLDYNLIEAFDQPWKRELEGTVGGHWGFFTTHRQPKFPWTGPVTEHPLWRVEGTAAFLLSLIILGVMTWRGGQRDALAGLGMGLGASLAGSALLLQAEHSMIAWRSPVEGIVEALVFAQSLAFVVLVFPELTKGRQAPAPLSIAETIAWLRSPDRTSAGTSLYLGLTQFAAAFSALVISIGLSFDNRYRDFPLAAYGIAALSLALLALNRGDYRRQPAGRNEEALFALLFVITTGVIAFNEGPRNVEALCWCALNLLFVVPWLGNLRAAIRSFLSRPAATAKA